MQRRPVAASLVLAATLLAPALGDVDAEVRNGDRVTSTLSPATETERFRLLIPRGAALSVRVKGLKKAKSPRIRVLDPELDALAGDGAPISSVTKLAIAATGEHQVVVNSADGTATGDYSFAATWKSAKPAPETVTFGIAAERTVGFAADAGAKVKVTAKAAKGSTALPRILGISGPGGDVPSGADLTGGATDKIGPVTLPATGEYLVRLDDTGAGGDVVVTVQIAPAKASKRKLDVSAKRAGTGDDTGAYAKVLDPLGGEVVVPPGIDGLAGLEGTSLSVPAGALPSGTALLIGTSTDFDFRDPNVQATGPAVLLGPEGLKFGTKSDPKAVGVSIPVDLASVGGDTSKIRVFTRDAKGRISEIDSGTLDFTTPGFVSFPTPHFSSFVAATGEASETGSFMITLVDQLPGGADLAVNFTSSDFAFFFADGTDVLQALSVTESGYAVDAFAGGGSLTADGTDKLDFDFGGPITAVATGPDAVFVGTATQVFRIDASTNLVTRFLGDGTAGDSGDDGPAVAARIRSCGDLFVDDNDDVLIVDTLSARVRRVDGQGTVTTFAGTGVNGSNGDTSPPANTLLDTPTGITQRLGTTEYYLAERGRVRGIFPDVLDVETLAGDPNGGVGCTEPGTSGTSARFDGLSGVAQDFTGGRLVASSAACHAIYAVDVTTRAVTTLIGTGTAGSTPDGPVLTTSRIKAPTGLLALGAITFFFDSSDGAGKVRLRELFVE